MSINFPTDNSTQNIGRTYTAGSVYSGFTTSNYITSFITPYDLISDRQASILNLSNALQANIDKKQNILVSTCNLIGIGSAITQLDYNNITFNKPDISSFGINYWSLSNTTIFNLTCNLGIGTTNTLGSRLSIIASTIGDGGNNSGRNSCLYIKQTSGWGANQPWALYVDGYSYLGGFRINAADAPRALYSTSTVGLGFATFNAVPITFIQNNSTERMRIDSTGNLCIGTTISDGYRLNIAGNSVISGSLYQNNSTLSNIFLGKIGIGTTNIGSYSLNIAGSLNATSFSSNTIPIDFNSYATTTSLISTSNILRGVINASNLTASNTLQSTINASNIASSNIFLSKSGGTITSNLIINSGITTAERQYPPKTFNNSNAETITTFLGQSAYIQTITLNSTGITYGSGDYIIYSSTFIASMTLLFNYSFSSGSAASWAYNQYNGANGLYLNANNKFIKNNYLGDWLIIKLPNPIILTRYTFYPRGISYSRLPGLWKFYGSVDGITFNEILEAHNDITRITDTYYSTNGFYEKTLASTFNTPYLYYGFTVSQLSGNDNLIVITEFQIFGKEFINNAVLSIGTTETSTYSLNVAGSLNASSFSSNTIPIDFTSYATTTALTTASNTLQATINASNFTASNFTTITSNTLQATINASNIASSNIFLSKSGGTITNNLIIDNSLTPERQYPSKAYTSLTAESTTPFLGKTIYTETITLNTTNITYGSGDYVIYSSSSIGSSFSKNHLFNYISSNDGTGHWAPNQYILSSGLYSNVNNNFIKNDYLGDWLVIKLPNPIILTRYRFYTRSGFENRSPGLWKFYGSMNDVTFNEIPEAHNDITIISSSYYSTNGFYEKTLASTFNTPYLYIGFTVNRLAGNDSILNFNEIEIFGKEKFTNSAFLSIGTSDVSTYSLNVAGSLNASSFSSNTIPIDFTSYATTTALTTASNTLQATINASNINLSDIFLSKSGGTITSNLIINNSSSTLSNERQYPSKKYNYETLETTIPLLGDTVYTQTLILDTTGITYGSGNYTIYSSTIYASSILVYKKSSLFNYTFENETAAWSDNQYSNGVYIDSNNKYIISDYKGEWIIIQFPNPIILTRFIFYRRPTVNSYSGRAPGEWKCYGSSDGINFTEIIEGSQSSRLSNTNYSSASYEKILSPAISTPYKYIGWTINKLAGTTANDTMLNFAEIQIFGKEFINTAFLSIGTSDVSTYSLNVAGSLNASNIYENGSLISSKYLQENSDASKLINFKLENQSNLIFPVSILTASTTTFNSSSSYGNGTYTITASSFATGKDPYFCFDNIAGNEWSPSSSTAYNGTSNLYGSTTYSTVVGGSNYLGEWIQLYYDKGFAAKSFTVTGISASNIRCPNNFILAASINASNWILLANEIGISDYTNIPSKTFSIYNFTSYNYYRIIVTKTIADPSLSISGLSFTGTQNTSFINNDTYNIDIYNTNEKQFPYRLFDNASIETLLTSNEIFNVVPALPYKQNLFVDNYTYTIYSSTINGSKSNLFDNSASTVGSWAANQYTSGVYSVNTNYIADSSYKGDWIIIKFPFKIVLTAYKFYQVSTNATTIASAPGTWKCYGSNDGVNWTEIIDASNSTTVAVYFGFTYTNLMPSYFNIPYLYIGWVINKLVDITTNYLSLTEIQIFGKDDNSTSLLTLNNTFNVNPNSNQKFPSAGFNSTIAQTRTSTEIFNCSPANVYKESAIVNNDGIYTIYYSSWNANNFTTLIDNNTSNSTDTATWGTVRYSSSIRTFLVGNDPCYIGDPSYNGDWFIIKFPYKISMSQFRFFQRQDGGATACAPGLWKCYGSNDGITWIEIKEASNTVTTTSYSSFANTITLQKVTPFYLYIGWVIGALFSTGVNILRFSEVQVFGTSIMKTIGTNTYSQNLNLIQGKISIGNNRSLNTPATGQYGGNGDKIILWEGSSAVEPYSIGMGAPALWNSVPNGARFEWYMARTARMTLNSAGALFTDGSGLNNLNLENQSIVPFPPTALGSSSAGYSTNTLGHGNYIVSSSSTHASSKDPFRAFDSSSTTEWSPLNALYTGTNNVYAGTVSTLVSDVLYQGEWIQLNYNKGFSLTSLAITGLVASNLKCPNNFIVAGSINGSNWTLLSSQVGITNYTTTPTKTFSIYNSTNYNFYRIIVTKTIGDTNVSIQNISMRGTQNSTYANVDTLNNFIYNTNEKQFLPSVYSSATPTTEIATTIQEVFNCIPTLAIKQILAINNQNYYIYSSTSTGITSNNKEFLFNPSNTNIVSWATSQYTNGVYSANTNYISDSTYKGDWIIIEFPFKLVLTKFAFTQTINTNRSPSKWELLGSFDGVTWNEITEGHNATGAVYTNSKTTTELPSYYDTPYLYYGWVFSALVGTAADASVLELQSMEIFGKDDIANAYSNVWIKSNSNIYNNLGNVGIGTTNPGSYLLNVAGSLNATSFLSNTLPIDFNSYATTTALAGKENTLTFSSPLTRTTNTISIDLSAYSTTSTNNTNYLRLAAATNDLTGKLAFSNNMNLLNAPEIADYGGVGDRIILWKGGGNYPYSLGMNVGTMWYSVPVGAIHNFYVNGTSIYQINSTGMSVAGNSYFSGNVGIGTTASQQLHLHGGALYITGNSGITGDTASASFWNQSGVGPTIAGANIAFRTNGSTERMRITSAGNVGIGTSNPLSTLHINAGAILKVLSFYDLGNNFQYTGFGATSGLIHNIPSTVDAFQFRVGTSTTAANEVMRITGTGNVGIGTTNPLSTLHINAGSILKVLSFYDLGNNFQYTGFGATSGLIHNIPSTGDAFQFRVGTSTTAANEVMRITGTGNVGIGITNPVNKLTINNIPVHRSTFDHSTSPVTITHPTVTSSTVLNDPQTLIHLCRDGTSGLAHGARASLKLSRYEHLSTNSRTRLDLTLAHNSYDDAHIMSFYSSGNIGIGTTNPGTRLHIQHASTSSGGLQGGLYVFNPNNAANNCSVIGARIAGNLANRAGISFDVSGHYGWNIGINGADTTNRLLRFSNKFDASGTDVMVLGSNGNVGIGVTNPQQILDINGSLVIRAAEANEGGIKGIFFRDQYTGVGNYYNCSILTYNHAAAVAEVFSDGLSINGWDGVSICTGANTRQERMRVDKDGNVYIGTTTNPNSYRLNVAGSLNATSFLSNTLPIDFNSYASTTALTTASNTLQTNINTNNAIASNYTYNNLISSNTSIHNQYPSKLYDTASTQSNITYLNQTPVYYENITVTNEGTYDIYASSIDDTNIQITGTNNTINDVNNNSEYSYISFVNNGSVIFNSNIVCDILVVGGGGSGGGYGGGGGGGGAVVYVTNATIAAGTYNVVVGSGGARASYNNPGNKGGNSSFAGIIAEGGGGGGNMPTGYNGTALPGGSGGGAGADYDLNDGINVIGASVGTQTSLNGYSGIIYQNKGGDGLDKNSLTLAGAGGGGGAGEIGQNGNLNYNGIGGKGGDGIQINITGTNLYWGAGGGGAQNASFDNSGTFRAGSGGLGGGGGGGWGGTDNWTQVNGYFGYGGTGGLNNGGNGSEDFGGAGASNTGSGGGGGAFTPNLMQNGQQITASGAGGSGIVIIRYLKSTITTKKELVIDNTDNSGCSFKSFQYTNNGYYVFNNRYILSGYFGDWFVLKMPNSIYLTKYRIYNRTSFAGRAPALFKIYGSTDGTSYEEIVEASNNDLNNILTPLNYLIGYYEKIVNYYQKKYLYFGIVVNKIVGGDSYSHLLNITKFHIFGNETNANNIIVPRYLSYNGTTQTFTGILTNTGIIINSNLINGPGNITLTGSSSTISGSNLIVPSSLIYKGTELSSLLQNTITTILNTSNTLQETINANNFISSNFTRINSNILSGTINTTSNILRGVINSSNLTASNYTNIISNILQANINQISAGGSSSTSSIYNDASQYNNFKLENNQSNLIYPPIGISTSAVSSFTSALVQSQFGNYQVSASSNNATAYLAFDKNLTTEFAINGAYSNTSGNYSNSGAYITNTFVSGNAIRGEWLQLYYDKGFVANSIRISGVAANSAKCPKDFVFAASKEGSNWILLSSQVGITTTAYSPSNIYSIYNFTSYNYYRLIVTKTISSTNLNIADVSLGGNPNTSFTPLDNYNIQVYNTNEKQFPPRPWDGTVTAEALTSNEIFNVTPTSYYKQQFSLNNHGNYIIYSSSTYGAAYTRSSLFNYDFTDSSGNIMASWVNSNYAAGQAVAGNLNAVGLNNNYYGDWIVVRFPYPILLTRFRFYGRPGLLNRSPGFWRCYGSNDGVNWTEITDASNTPAISTIATYTITDTNGTYYEKTVLNLDIAYLYIGWVVNQLATAVTDSTILNFGELQIFGKDDISNSYLNTLSKSTTTTSIISTQTYPPTYLRASTTTISGTSYGSGTYIATSGSQLDSQQTFFSCVGANAFNSNTSNPVFNQWTSAHGIFNTSGNYTGSSRTIINGISTLGEFGSVQFPYPIILTGYSLTSSYNGYHNYMMRNFKLCGSIDGINFIELDSRIDQVWTVPTTPPLAGETKNYTFTNTRAYLHYRIVITKTSNFLSDPNYSHTVCCGIFFFGYEQKDGASIQTIGINTNPLSNVSLNVVGNANIIGNVGIGTISPNACLELSSTIQRLPKLILSGQEFVKHGNTGDNNFTSNGIAFLLGVNRPNNRQLWIANSDYLTSNTTNPVLRIQPNPTNGTCFIDSIATDHLTSLKLSLGNSASQTLINGNVGIGTDNPQQRLAVVGNSYFNGNVGIGTTTPGSTLTVVGNANISGTLTLSNMLIQNFLFNNTGISHEASIRNFNDVTSFGYRHILDPTVNSPDTSTTSQKYYSWYIGLGSNFGADSYGAQFAIPRNLTNPTMSIRFKEGSTWYGWSAITAGFLKGNANFNVDTWQNSTDTKQRIFFANNGTTFIKGHGTSPLIFRNSTDSNVITVLNNGSVGIGTTTPGELLNLYGTADCFAKIDASGGTGQAGLRLFAGSNTSHRASRIDFFNNITSTSAPRWTLISDTIQNGTNDFRVVNGAGASVFTILQSGNIGIGTTTPASPLVVVGNSYFNGNVGIGTTPSTSDGNMLRLYTTFAGANDQLLITGTSTIGVTNIRLSNGGTGVADAFIGLAGTAYGSTGDLYRNNLYLQSPSSIVFNTQGRGSSSANMIILGNGYVGIGTTNPSQLLDVYSANISYNNYIRVRSETAREAGIIFDRNGTLWQICNKGTGYTEVNNLCFQSSSVLSVLELTQSGNVGIGITNPTQKLTVVGNSYFNGNIGIGTSTPSQQLHLNAGALYITGSASITGDTASASFWNQSGVGPTIAGANIAFQTNGSAERMRITSAGNVGIGITNPRSRLEVIGACAINNGNSYAIANNFVAAGALCIGDTNTDYGGSTGGWVANTAGLIMECSNNTEIAIHDNATRVASFMQYVGTSNQFIIGRNMGWDEIARINLIGNVGIGTTIGATSKLCVNRNPLHNGGFDFTTSPCVITNLTPSSASALNDPRPILHLCREGTGGEAYGQRLTFSLCRFENETSLLASRTRCDIILAENGFINTNIMTLLSSGRIGIGTTNPKSMLELYSTSQTVPEIILSGTDFSTNTTSTSGVAFLLGSNLTNDRQFWIADSSALGVGTTNPVIRIMPNTRTIDAVATNGTTALPLTIGNINSPLYLNGNVIYIDGSGLNDLKVDNYQSNLIYPPSSVSLISNTITLSNNQLNNGIYTVSASSNLATAYLAFDNNTSTEFSITSAYNNTSGTYVNTGIYITSTMVNTNSYLSFYKSPQASGLTLFKVDGEWIQIFYDRGFVANSFSIGGITANNGKYPKDFILAGSMNGSNWFMLSSQSNISNYVTGSAKTFTFSNFTSYNFYRLIVTKTVSDSSLSIAELKFSGFANTVYANQDTMNSIIYNTGERQFPPKTFDIVDSTAADTLTTTPDIYNIVPPACFKKIMIIYTNGRYEIYSSSTATNYGKHRLFNYSSYAINTFWSANNYDSNGNINSGILSTIGLNNNYYGEWIIIKMSYLIVLTRFRFYILTAATALQTASAPGLWRCYGSIDGVNWNEITDASNSVSTSIATYTLSDTNGKYFEKILPNLFTTPYLYIGWVFNKLSGTDVTAMRLHFLKIFIYGKTDISNAYNDVWSQSGNNVNSTMNIYIDGSGLNNLKLDDNQKLLTFPPGIINMTRALSTSNSQQQNGYYVCSSSTNSDNSYNAFDGENANNFTISTSVYNVNGTYNGSISTFVNNTQYFGEWIQLYYDKGFVAKSITILTNVFDNNQNPKDFLLVSSINGSNWNLLSIQQNIITYSISNIYSIYNNTSYNYYRLIVQKTIASSTLSIGDISFRGVINTCYANLDNYNIQLYNTNEKRFPPRVWDVAPATEASSSNEIFNITPVSYFRQQFSLNNHGTYVIYSSSAYPPPLSKSALFNYDFVDSSGHNTAHWALNYTAGVLNSGIINTIGLNNNYYGDWIVVKFPYQILLTRFRFYARNGIIGRAPGFWKCYGSNDGVNWTEITDASNSSPIAAIATYTTTDDSVYYYYQKTVLNLNIPYLYIGWVVNQLSGSSPGETVMNFAEMQIFGKDDISNSYLNVWNKTNTSIFNTLGNVGIGTTNPAAPLHVVGNIFATGDVAAYYSDIRLKNVISNINNPINIINSLKGFYYTPNDLAISLGYSNIKQEIGLSAQDVKNVLPEIVDLAPFDVTTNENGEIISKSGNNYLTLNYQRLVPVLIEGTKDLYKLIQQLQQQVAELTNRISILEAK